MTFYPAKNDHNSVIEFSAVCAKEDQMSKPKFEDAEVYSPSMSASGNNAFYLDHCDSIGHRPAYCACVNKIEAVNRGESLFVGGQCEGEIRRGRCKATAMREREQRENKALFFISREKLHHFQAEKQEYDVAAAVRKAKRKGEALPASVKVQAADPFMTTGGYADAINSALSQTKFSVPTKPKLAPQPNPAIEPTRVAAPVNLAPVAPVKAGMSILEMARVQLAARTQIQN